MYERWQQEREEKENRNKQLIEEYAKECLNELDGFIRSEIMHADLMDSKNTLKREYKKYIAIIGDSKLSGVERVDKLQSEAEAYLKKHKNNAGAAHELIKKINLMDVLPSELHQQHPEYYRSSYNKLVARDFELIDKIDEINAADHRAGEYLNVVRTMINLDINILERKGEAGTPKDKGNASDVKKEYKPYIQILDDNKLNDRQKLAAIIKFADDDASYLKKGGLHFKFASIDPAINLEGSRTQADMRKYLDKLDAISAKITRPTQTASAPARLGGNSMFAKQKPSEPVTLQPSSKKTTSPK